MGDAREDKAMQGGKYPRNLQQEKRGIRPLEVVLLILILFVCAAILFPAFATGGHDFRRSNAISNLKQLALANVMYAGDFDERLPLANTWMDATFPYNKHEEILVDPYLKEPKPGEHGFAFFRPLAGIETTIVVEPESVPMLFQSTLLGRNATSDLSTLPRPPRIKSGNVIGYLDTHVRIEPLGPLRARFRLRLDESLRDKLNNEAQ